MHVRLMIAAAALPLLAAMPAHAAISCDLGALNALKIADIAVTEVKSVAASPAHCEVLGTVVTKGEGAPEGLARFAMQLPNGWKQRFLFLGVGGNAGTLQPSANAVDRAAALGKGYAVIVTDTGHAGDGTSAKWARRPDGSIDAAKLADFFFRAAHDVAVAGKALAQAYYAAPIAHAYFDGCSTGGRMALVEAEHYPADYSGIIAGDPAMDFKLNLARIAVQKAMLKPHAFIPQETLVAIDQRVTKTCDALDGATDGIVQDPTKCPVRAEDLLCRPGETTACLNADQVALLHTYTTPLRDKAGRMVYPAWAITNLSGGPAVENYTTGKTPPDLTQPAAPWGADGKAAPRGWALSHESLAYYLGAGPDADMNRLDIDANNVVGDAVLKDQAMFAPGEGGDASKLKPFVARGGKLILYHGTSDPAIPAARTVMFYQELARLLGGEDKAAANVRLFLVPGMHHCGGGVGPDRFDTLTALENWVEGGNAPAAISASTRADSPAPHRLPLCPYPEQARFAGGGDVTDEKNWACKRADAR